MPKESSQPRVFYGFIVVAFASLICTLVYGAQYSFGVFFEPLLDYFGWTRAMTSSAFSVYMIVQGFFYMVTGQLNDRFGPRITVTICGFIFGLGYIMMSTVDAIWKMYIFYGVMIAIGVSGAFVPLTSCAARWFEKMRGMMTGIVVAGIGIGTMVMAPLANWMIQSYGWQHAYLYGGIVFLVVIVISAQFLRRDPGTMGLLPYGMTSSDNIPQDAEQKQTAGLPLAEAFKTRQFWVISGIYLCFGYVLFSASVHVVIYASGRGVAPASAAVILTVLGGASIAGKILLGSLADKKGTRLAVFSGLIMLIIGLLALMIADKLWIYYLGGVFFGLGYGAVVATLSLLVVENFGLRSHGTILGITLAVSGIGGAVGPWLSGYIFDVKQSYFQAWLICVACCVAAILLVLLLKPLSRSR